MSVRTYEWCFSMPPRCSKWNTEMRDLTRLETEERTAEVAICCPGYKMKDVSCVPICPNGRTGPGCSDACPTNKWGPNCVNECGSCEHGSCSPITGECRCRDGWQGESCEISMPPITISTLKVEVLTPTPTTKTSAMPTTTPAVTSTRITTVANKTAPKKEIAEITTETISTTSFTTISKFLNTADPESTTEFTYTISPVNETTITTNLFNTYETIVTEAVEPTLKVFTPIYNRTDIPSVIKEQNFTTVMFELNSTTSEQIFEQITTTLTSIKSVEKKSEPELMRSIKDPERSKDNQFTVTSTTTSTEYGSPPSTTTQMKSTTPAITTEIAHTKLASTIKEIAASVPPTIKEVTKTMTTQSPEATMKTPTTIKFKPKEIWIKPALKGEATETKKAIYDISKHRISTNQDFTINTTPKTIIVSIIPTSVSYATFKKIALTTASYLIKKNNTTSRNYNKSTELFMKIPLTSTTTKLGLQLSTVLNTTASAMLNEATRTTKPLSTKNFKTPSKSESASINKSVVNSTNMTEKLIVENTNSSAKAISSTDFKLITKRMTLINDIPSTTPIIKTEYSHKYYITAKNRNMTKSATHKSKDDKVTQPRKDNQKILTNINKVTTEDPTDEEVFHILTEPEHITAVMGEKERGRTSMDLVSVISIAGGIMMAVITVAVIIVMVERCKRPRYENVRKINDIHMQVMIDNNDPPPPYVRSIFHTPLPDPPMSDKCHYQPISTLDRNLKQFMRPVVVQTISPIMLENFRGILECHYDHLPRRSHGFATVERCCTLSPSMSSGSELRCMHSGITDSTIEALKCEAKMDTIDTTTSEPLYAEIPCWRPPSEHATEILNLNGEAVTEL